jgi:hypothetical protein
VNDRFRIEEHRGHRIVVLDISDATPADYAPWIAEAVALIAREGEGRGKALIATLVHRARFTMQTLEQVKAYSAAIRPHVRGSAVIGLSPLHKVVFVGLKPFLHPTAALFEELAGAKEWLVSLR